MDHRIRSNDARRRVDRVRLPVSLSPSLSVSQSLSLSVSQSLCLSERLCLYWRID